MAYVGDSAAANSTAIYLYSSATGPQKLTDDGTYPFLNNKGQVIWTNSPGDLLIKSKHPSAASSTMDFPVYPTMNNRGQVAWQGESSGDGIFLSQPVTGLPGPQLLLLD